LTPIWGCCII